MVTIDDVKDQLGIARTSTMFDTMLGMILEDASELIRVSLRLEQLPPSDGLVRRLLLVECVDLFQQRGSTTEKPVNYLPVKRSLYAAIEARRRKTIQEDAAAPSP